MSDEIFRLGNFTDLPEGAEEPETQGVLPPDPEPKDSPANKLIKHPSMAANPQARFFAQDGAPLAEIELDKIVPNAFQPRRIFNPEKLQELANSIKEHGIIQPLVVVKREDGFFEIVVGERRFRAARLAGLSKVPVFVSPKISAETKLELALIENIQRADLNPIEEAKAYERLHEEFGLSYSEVARKVGKDNSTIANLIRLLKLPAEVQRALVEGKISEGQARPLLTLRDPEEMIQMFHIVARDQMKVRDIERKVREIRERRIKVQDMFTPDPFLQSLENLLRNKLGTRVAVDKGAKGGKITIEFYSDEELSDIVNKIA